MAAMFVGQQYLQNVLGYSTLEAGAAILPAAIVMVLVAPRSAKLVEARGARFTLLFGYVCLFLGFVTMLLLWDEGSPYWQVGLGYVFIGVGVGFAGTPASHSLTGSVPGDPRRHGVGNGRSSARSRRRDHAVDLRRAADRRLRVGDVRGDRAPPEEDVTDSTQSAADEVVRRLPRRLPPSTRSTRTQITSAAKESFLEGDDWAYAAGLGGGRARCLFSSSPCSPRHDDEVRLLAEYHAKDAAVSDVSRPAQPLDAV